MRFGLSQPTWIAPAVALAFVLGLTFGGGSEAPAREQRSGVAVMRAFELEQGRTLYPVDLLIPPGRAGKQLRVDHGVLSTRQLYLVGPGTEEQEFIHVDSAGRVHHSGTIVGKVGDQAEVLITPTGTTLFVDDVPLPVDITGWRVHWVTDRDAPPPARAVSLIPRIEVRDDFMRKELELHPYSRVTSGAVRLAQRGGGMPTTEAEAADPAFERTVNPFAVYASNHGRLTYNVHGADRWGDVHAEARFYFGIPKTGTVVDRNTLPLETDMFVVQGAADGQQIAFGWSGQNRAFVLQTRERNGTWRVVQEREGKRPALTNWVKIGLDVRRGHLVEAFLDDVPVLRADLGIRIKGPFHVASGKGLVEFDDVRAWSLPEEHRPAPLLHATSRQFAGKQRKNGADPEQFGQWAASTRAFSRVRWEDADTGDQMAAIVTGMPLMGDLWYEAIASSRVSGLLREGVYEFGLFRSRADGGIPDIVADKPVYALRVERQGGRWHVPKEGTDDREPDAAPRLGQLRLARLEDHESRVCLHVDGRWEPISPSILGPVHLAITRVQLAANGRRFLFSPSPNHHRVRCGSLVNEFFEDAPSEWSWIDGSFRMDCRWACEDQWNFMGCGSVGLPYMTSKRTFGGDQIHEYFICLRAVFPWDAGDDTFTFDSDADRANGHQLIRANSGWYNRRDLNFSFCTDGRNPLSGYSVVFAGDDNTETRLLRRGRPVACTRSPEFLFTRDPSHRAVHWDWWKFTVRKIGNRILVFLNDSLMFDYTDPEILDEGHIGFWSVRNGFALSRVTSVAERQGRRADVLYVSDDVASPWQPLLRDGVVLSQDTGSSLFQVTNSRGGGFFAVRYTPEEPIDLRKTPVLELPITVNDDANANLHLFIGDESFIVRLGDAPLPGMKSLLTPEFEKGECFQIPTMSLDHMRRSRCLGSVRAENGVVRIDLLKGMRQLGRVPARPLLTAMTLGNTSNAHYLLAGNGGNRAGSRYCVGSPSFLPK